MIIVFLTEGSSVTYIFSFLFIQATSVRGAVIVEKTLTSAQYFLDVQKFCVGNLGLDLVPVKNQSEAAAFLVQLVSASLNRGLVRYLLFLGWYNSGFPLPTVGLCTVYSASLCQTNDCPQGSGLDCS